MAATIPATEFLVSWGATDDGAGPAGSGATYYDVFVCDNGGDYQPFQRFTTQTSAMFTGETGHTYHFYSVAVDNVGHREGTPSAADSSTTLVAATGDFGDAPDSYGTLAASNGALHLPGSSLQLGSLRDGESDGHPSALANGDDLEGSDDEDGVQLPAALIARLSATALVTASGAGRLDAWIDFNRNGVFESSEQIADNLLVAAGLNNVTFTVPATASAGASYARFRISTAGNLNPTGTADDGEVEDYRVQIETLAVKSSRILPDPENFGQNVWVVMGTSGKDNIDFSGVVSNTVTLKFNGKVFARAQQNSFNRIVVYGQAGNDHIELASTLNKPALLFGEQGNDWLEGGSAADRIFGGPGNDTLYGNGGDDYLAFDDTAAPIVANLGTGKDAVHIGQLYTDPSEGVARAIASKSLINATSCKASACRNCDKDTRHGKLLLTSSSPFNTPAMAMAARSTTVSACCMKSRTIAAKPACSAQTY